MKVKKGKRRKGRRAASKYSSRGAGFPSIQSIQSIYSLALRVMQGIRRFQSITSHTALTDRVKAPHEVAFSHFIQPPAFS
jgi:hypothetical protein